MARESIEVLKECEAFLEGHFLLSSGRHSGAYCQMAYLQQYPDKCAEVMAHVAEKLKDTDVDVIVGPAMGGIVYAYELGRQLGKRAIFTERVDNVMTLKRFAIHPGERCIIAEDVVTTGVSSLETKRVIEEAGVQSGAMIVDLTAKDKLSRRIEFFAASGIAVKEIIKQYSIQIFRFSGIIPFFVFMSCYYFTDWTMSFGRIVCVYLSILVLSFCEIVALNIIVLDVKRVKLFKNVLFFGNFALVYLIAMSAERITEFVNQHHIGIDYLIIVVDVALCMMFALLSFFKARHMSNEAVIRRDGEWV